MAPKAEDTDLALDKGRSSLHVSVNVGGKSLPFCFHLFDLAKAWSPLLPLFSSSWSLLLEGCPEPGSMEGSRGRHMDR